MATYTTEAASVSFFAVQPQRSRAPPPPLNRTHGAQNASSHQNHTSVSPNTHSMYQGGGSLFTAMPPQHYQPPPGSYGLAAAPPPPSQMGMYPPTSYSAPHAGGMNGGPYGPQAPLPPSSANYLGSGPRFPQPYTSMPPPPLPPPSQQQQQSLPQRPGYAHFTNTPTRWLQDQTPTKCRSLSYTHDDPSVMSGTTPAGLSASRMKGSHPGMSSLMGGNSPSSLLLSPQRAYSGVALEKDLLQAHKDELVQILLELASCDVAASSFIHTKARFFAFRRDVDQHHPTQTESVDVDTADCSAKASDKSTAQSSSVSAAQGSEKRTCVSASKAPVPPQTGMLLGEEDEEAGADTSAIHVASQHESAIHGDTSRILFSAGSSPAALPVTHTPDATPAGEGDEAQIVSLLPQHPSHRPSPSRGQPTNRLNSPHPAAGTRSADAHVQHRASPEARPFASTCHPCLRWYGTCRNPTSCIYVALPQNVCLNWVRGACAAAAQCSGAHRLPETCPPEVRRIYELCHGVLDRRDMVSTASVLNSAARPVTRSPESSSPLRSPHTPRLQILSQPQTMIPSVLLAQNATHMPAVASPDACDGVSERVVETATPSRLASCSEDEIAALLDQGLRPALQTAAHMLDGDDCEDGEEANAPVVFRCLNDSFARAANLTSDYSNGSH